ncbi:hypothetical protein BC941DRAFT_428779 [Chlamydoabsidia padenii]|nr:hypothetical protein BC941DRAFT_428779 [Chlamydoabsidia padenii]
MSSTQSSSKYNKDTISNHGIVDLSEIPLEITGLIKQTTSTIGQLGFLSREIEKFGKELDIVKARCPVMSSHTNNNIKVLQESIDEKKKLFNQEQNKATKLVAQIANQYKDTFSMGLEDIRERIEESMVKFGSILSKDALDQINQRSSELSTKLIKITNEQDDKIKKITNSMNSTIRGYDEKLNQLDKTIAECSKTADRLNNSNIHFIQAIANNSNKLKAYQQKQDENHAKIKKDMESLRERIVRNTTALEKLSADLTRSVRDDMETMSREMYKLQRDQHESKRSREKLESHYQIIKQQVTDIIKNKNSNGSTSASTSSTTKMEYNNLKLMLDQQEQKLNEFQNMVTTLVRNNKAPLSASDNKTTTTTTTRLDDLEKHMTELLSKVEVVQKQIDDNKEVTKKESTTIVGVKRPLESVDDVLPTDGGDISKDDKLKSMEIELKRMDNKISSLAEYVYQFRPTILDPGFPQKLENTMHHFESCLKNHELFIAYLVDPLTTLQTINKAHPTTSLMTSEQSQQSHPLVSPTMLTTISQFVIDELKNQKNASHMAKRHKPMDKATEKAMMVYTKKYMDELVMNQVKPLQKKIQLLEQQLQQRVNQK